MLLYNTLTGKKEEFKPLDPNGKKVGLYTCGPTVYNYVHIGNLRAYIFADTLRRTLKYSGFEVKHVMNVTDVGHLTSDEDDGDDKMIKALKREGKPFTFEAMQEIARKYETAFKEDMSALNIKQPKDMPRASENIPEDIEIVNKLLEKGVAYKTSDGIYFDTSKFPSYGTRGGFKLGDLKDGARVAVNVEKKNPQDFSLWKFSTTDLGWDFPQYGKGFPGWHIECSGMSRKFLGQPFDIHTGGIDHIPVHHQNEIAQSETAYDVPLANYWIHNEFLNIPEGKMAKSGENFITLKTLTDKGIHPLAYRYYLLQAHYRSPIRFSWEALRSAQIGYHGLLMKFIKEENASTSTDEKRERDVLSQIKESLNDDLNTAFPIGLLWSSSSFLHTFSGVAVKDLDLMLGLDIESQSRKLIEEMSAIPEDIKKLSLARDEARKEKDYKKSDELRDRITKEGFDVLDTDGGSIIRKSLQ